MKTTTKNHGQSGVSNPEDKYRLLQAVELIQSFRETIELDGQAVEVPVFVPSDSEPGAFVRNPLLARQETAQNAKSNEDNQ